MVEGKDSEKTKIFQGKRIRTHWDEEKEKWFFSIVDVVAILTESVDHFAYWRKLKQRLLEEGNETVTNCHVLKMVAQDGKLRETDVGDTEGIFLINRKAYKHKFINAISSLRIVSMIPGDRKVAGCLFFGNLPEGGFYGRCFGFCR